MQLSLRLRNRFLSFSLPGPNDGHKHWIPPVHVSGAVVIFWIPGFPLLTEIQVSNELLACGLCRHLEYFDLAA